MALAPGITLTQDTPPVARPTERPIRMEDVPLVFAGQPVRGRRAPDNSQWCLCCDTTISTRANAAFCDRHRTERNTQIAAGARVSVAAIPTDAVEEIVRRTDAVMTALGRATVRFNAMPNPPRGGWVDDLMLATKNLAGAVDGTLRPYVKR